MRPDVPLEKEEQAEALFNRVMELPFRRKQDLGKKFHRANPRSFFWHRANPAVIARVNCATRSS
jgi:hypothetical protein